MKQLLGPNTGILQWQPGTEPADLKPTPTEEAYLAMLEEKDVEIADLKRLTETNTERIQALAGRNTLLFSDLIVWKNRARARLVIVGVLGALFIATVVCAVMILNVRP